MERGRITLTISVSWMIALVALIAVVGVLLHHHGLIGNAAAAELKPMTRLESWQDEFIALAEYAKPAVVNISTEQKVEPAATEPQSQLDELFKEFRRRFGDEFQFQLPAPPEAQPRTSLGSGVVIDPQGYILTSSHVVRNAEKITVTLSDQTELDATITAMDPQTDLAVIKVEPKEGKGALTALPLGDASKQQVGSWVMAIGSPLGLEQTVTVGVISAKHRTFENPNVPGRPFREMLQTDAVINPGNSGGPLLNLHGEVVGINTLIVSTTGFSIGLGFASPINPGTQAIIQTLKAGKTPTRGMLGVYIRSVNEAMARVYGIDNGAYVSEVMPDSPAAKAGIEAQDIITQYGDKKVSDEQDLVQAVEQTKPGSEVPVTVFRNGQTKVLTVKIGEVPAQKQATAAPPAVEKLGLTVTDITPQLRESYSIEAKQGVVVTKVAPNSDGARAGLRPGDVIVTINRADIGSLDDYRAAVEKLKPADSVVLRAWRGDRVNVYTILSLGK